MNTIISQLKKYTVFGAVALTAIVYTGCTDLDENPYTFIDPDKFYNTEAEINAALNNTYRAYRNQAGSARNYIAPLEILTDVGEANYRKETQNHYRNTWSDMNNINNTFSDVWEKGFATINDANIVLGRVENVEMDATKKNYIKGQALFLRAYSFYHIVRIYGGCPIPLTYTEGVTGLKMPRESADKVWERIFTDLKDAAGMLPPRNTSNYEVWRVSKDACHALLGEAYLYKATISSKDNLTANKDELELSKQYSKLVIDEAKKGTYDLMQNYNDLWYWFNKNAKNGKESIFELQYFNGEGGECGMAVDFGVYGGMKKDGKVVAGAYYCRFGPTKDVYVSYDPKDTRRNVLLTEYTDKNNVNWKFDVEAEYWKDKDGNPLLIEGDRAYSFMTLINAKYIDPWADVNLYNSMPAPNFPQLRYAEVLLNYAEAANLLKAGDGLAELNLVHQRAGLTPLPAMGQKEMDDAILQERIWEFVGEGKIYFDELRKGVLGDRVEKTAHRSWKMYDNNEYLQNGIPNSRKKIFVCYPMTHKPTKSWLWKIPSKDISSNTLLEQNPENQSAALQYDWVASSEK